MGAPLEQNDELVEKAQLQEVIDEVKTRLDTKIDKSEAPYKPGGTVAFADLPEAVEENVGYVYNVSDAFTTTEDFLEGAGIKCAAGTDVAIVQVPPETAGGDPSYKYNLYGGTSALEKITSAELAEMWKDAGTVSLSDNTASLTSVGDTATITVTEATGAITVESSDKDVATASVSGTAITITEVAAGSATITVKSASSTDYREATTTIAVTCTE